MYAYQRYDDFTVRVSLEVVWSFQARSELDVVVDLAVDAEDNLSVVAHQGLSTGVCTPFW